MLEINCPLQIWFLYLSLSAQNFSFRTTRVCSRYLRCFSLLLCPLCLPNSLQNGGLMCKQIPKENRNCSWQNRESSFALNEDIVQECIDWKLQQIYCSKLENTFSDGWLKLEHSPRLLSYCNHLSGILIPYETNKYAQLSSVASKLGFYYSRWLFLLE